VSRKPVFLAALASSAVPGLDPVSVQAEVTEPGHYHQVAFVTDTQHRRWVVRAPLTPAAGAQMDATVALLQLIGRRLPFSVPAPRGFVAVPEGRAVVYPHLSGRPVDFAELPAGPGLAAEIGRAIAALHNVDRAVFDEAGLPVYDAEEYRTRRLADLDRAAATGHVPTALLSRWERALEEVSIWRFAPTPIHGGLTGEQVLVVFESDDASSGRVRGVTGWDDAKVADPAEDFAALVTACSPEAFESVLEAYAHSRVERPDRHLRRRARLASELRLLGSLLGAVSAGERELIKAHAADLRELDEQTVDEPDEHPQEGRAATSSAPVAAAASAARVDDEGTSGSGPTGSECAGDPDPDDLDEADDPDRFDGERTQPMSAGRFSEPTTVIPEDQLDRIRRSRGPATGQPPTAEPVTERPATEEPATGQPPTAEPVTERPATEQPVTERPATEEPATGQPPTEEPVTERTATEQPVTERPATEEAATERPATEVPVTERPATEVPVTERTARAGAETGAAAQASSKPQPADPVIEEPAAPGATSEGREPTKDQPSTTEGADAVGGPSAEPGIPEADIEPSLARAHIEDDGTPTEEPRPPATVEPPDRFR